MTEPLPPPPDLRSASALQIVAQHLSWAALVFYLVTYSHPAEVKWYVEQAAAARTSFFTAQERSEARCDVRVKGIENECHGRIQEDFALSQTNNRLLIQAIAMLEKKCSGQDGR